jgi:hypothetical protein
MSSFRVPLGLVAVAALIFSLTDCGGRSSTPSVPSLQSPVTSQVQRPAQVPATSLISITGIGTNAGLDNAVVSFMSAQHVRNGELAVSHSGTTIFSHAYTYSSLATSTTTTATIMRLASNTKAWTEAAIYKLKLAGKVNTSAKVFQYLGITTPLPIGAHVDPRVFNITIQNMLDHKSGWDDSIAPYYDPTFHMREIARSLGLTHEVDLMSYIRYQLGKPLQEAPGTTYAYCNYCYTVLGAVIAKASGMSYNAYIAQVAAGVGVSNVLMSPTVGARLPNEVAKYYSPYSGLSAVYVTSNTIYPAPYGGDDMALEVAQGATELATSANSMLAFMKHYVIWGLGPPQPGADWAREGSIEGTNTWAEQLPNGYNYAFLINTRQYTTANAFINLQNQIRHILDPAVAPFGRALPADDRH